MFTIGTQIVPVVLLILSIGTLASLEEPNDRPLNATSTKLNISTLPTHLTEDDIKSISLVSQTENSSQIFGEKDAEHFGELSVIDVLFRKRRKEGCDEKKSKSDYSEDYLRAEEAPESVEEEEFVSYEEIGSSEAVVEGEQRSGPSTVTDYLTPPAEDANFTNFVKGQYDGNTTEGTGTTDSV